MFTRRKKRVSGLSIFLASILFFSQLFTGFNLPVSAFSVNEENQTVTLVEWDFNSESPVATGGINKNANEEFTLVGANVTGYVAGFGLGSRAINSNSWHSTNENYWLATLSTEGFENIKLSSKQYGSNTGPKDFTLEYSLDGQSWTDVPHTTIEVGNNWTNGVLSNVSLPLALNDEDTIYVRWLNTSNVSVQGGTIGNTGTNRIDDVVISGTPLAEDVDPGEEIQTIAEARTMSGQEVTVLGVANIAQGLLQNGRFSLYIQDEEAGIQLFNFNTSPFPEVKEGDLVKATGIVGEHSGVTQLQVSSVEVVNHNQEIPVKNIPLSTYMDSSLAESYEGQLVRFEGFIRNINDYFNGGVSISIINDDFDAVDIRVWESTGIDLSQLEENTWYEVTAISSQFNSTYQVLPRNNDDFVKLAEQKPAPTTLNREYKAKVAHVTDGDTIRLATPILGATNVRFLNMDTPETYHTVQNELDENQMRHGKNATAYMQTMLQDGDTVILKLGEEPLDSYGRLLAEVYTEDGVNTNLEMVRAGYASTYFIYPFEDEKVEKYSVAAKYARENQKGIYNPEDPLLEMPFVFRARERGDNGLSRYVGNFKTKEYVAPDHYALVEPEYRVFFSKQQAEALGYSPFEMSDQEAIDMDKNALGVGFQGTETASTVVSDVTLETTGSYGSTITWKSSNEDVISTSGKVTNPKYESTEVTLTATLVKGNLTVTKEFHLVVLPAIVELVSWNFDQESTIATGGITDNKNSEITTVGSTITGYVAGFGSNSRAVNANGWQDGESYWLVELTTLDYKNITLSSRQYGSNTGPRDFRAEYSIDGVDWSVIPGSDLTVANNWNGGVLTNIALPKEVENQEKVFVRWINTSTVSINGGTVGSGGTNRIDNIVFTGNKGLFEEERQACFPGKGKMKGKDSFPGKGKGLARFCK